MNSFWLYYHSRYCILFVSSLSLKVKHFEPLLQVQFREYSFDIYVGVEKYPQSKRFFQHSSKVIFFPKTNILCLLFVIYLPFKKYCDISGRRQRGLYQKCSARLIKSRCLRPDISKANIFPNSSALLSPINIKRLPKTCYTFSLALL